MSLIKRNPKVEMILSALSSGGHAHEASGASLYGPDLSKWPAEMVDAQVLIQIQENITTNAIRDAFQRPGAMQERPGGPPQGMHS